MKAPVTDRILLPGAAPQVVESGVSLIRPEDQILERMLRGWTIQQQSRHLAEATIRGRLAVINGFVSYTNAYPWQWNAPDVEEWTTSLISERHLSHASIRGRQNALRLFMEYLTDPRYEWVPECERLFGAVPVQICHEWNTVEHLEEYEGRPERRHLTPDEVQALFDEADKRVATARRARRKGALAAFRNGVAIKVAYAWGLRRREVAMLELADFGRNPQVPEFGRFGWLHVRYGKALRGSPPRRRAVLTTMPWAVEAVQYYIDEVRPLFGFDGLPTLWPTERGGRLSVWKLDEFFAEVRDAAGLPSYLTIHGLRHAYVTHLAEQGWDPRFIQEQVGHSYASTTAIYTAVSSDFKNRVLRDALEDLYGLEPAKKERRR